MSWSCTSRTDAQNSSNKVIILGFDGVDPELLSQYMGEGRLPNFSRLAQNGSFMPLGTSIPPQSPVAWSNFITGMNPGGHGIFDFIHRDPNSMLPISSTTKIEESDKTLKIGNWIIPLSSAKLQNSRQGEAFWTILEEQGISTTVFKIPANFPPVDMKGNSLSGMGTPDLLGSFGTFSFYTDDPPPNRDDISGGIVYPVSMVDNMFEAELVGPKNTFLKDTPSTTTAFKVWRDPENPTLKIDIEDQHILLREKEWSAWIPVKFQIIPGLKSVSGICRFYVKEVRPKIKLYVTPINIDPSDPALPISTPGKFAQEIFENCGYFYSQGMPEETKALSWGIFDYDDFSSQSKNVLLERLRQFDYIFDKFKSGLLFFYFSSTDLNAHMFYNMIDPEHPNHVPELALKFANVIPSVYESLDEVVGKVLESVDQNTTLIVMSDHGFAPFRRSVHLNTWLKNEGYIKLLDESKQVEVDFFLNVDWSRTKVYGLGFNGLYVNLQGREYNGIINGRTKRTLLNKIAKKLLELRDPQNNAKIVDRVYFSEDIYSSQNLENAPDLIVGYSRGYRASWESTIGSFPLNWIEDNMDAWSGDHCMAAELVPGIILSNKKITLDNPKLYDLAPTILAEFGLNKSDQMVGKAIF